MNVYNWLFGKNTNLKSCPRCLGKGQVDWDDIKRLRQELKWIPGKCAYCNGSGKVDQGIESNVPVDAGYLVTNLQEEERQLIVKGNPDAIERGKLSEDNLNRFIDQIAYLHFEAGLTPDQITKFFLIGNPENDEQELSDYVERVIEKGGTSGHKMRLL